jgi:hypothetical protein
MSISRYIVVAVVKWSRACSPSPMRPQRAGRPPVVAERQS